MMDEPSDNSTPNNNSNKKLTETERFLLIVEEAKNKEEYFYCALSFFQSGIKLNVPLLTTLNFPQRLYIMLNHDDSNAGIIDWVLVGAVAILDKDRFVNEVIPRYFRYNTFRRFEKQLTAYGFHRFQHDSLEYCYRNRLFIRNRVEWVSNIPRIKMNNGKSKSRRRKNNIELSLWNDSDSDFVRTSQKSFPQTNKTPPALAKIRSLESIPPKVSMDECQDQSKSSSVIKSQDIVEKSDQTKNQKSEAYMEVMQYSMSQLISIYMKGNDEWNLKKRSLEDEDDGEDDDEEESA